jgi:enterobactin synthetase component F
VHEVLVDGLAGIPQWLREQRVEAVGLVPTLIRFMLPLLDDDLGPDGVLPDLTTVAVWGESSDWDVVARLSRHLPPQAMVHNAYASTETGMIAALSVSPAEVGAPGERSGPLPAGRPLPGVTVRILDDGGQDVPIGAPGEIAVASTHLAQGHWRRPDLTASVLLERSDRLLLWRTGDGGRLDADGSLHVEGRLDDVVKVSGHRVALGELEQAAREQHGVAAAAAVGRADPHGALRLHLFVVAHPGAALDARWIRSALARSLPPSALPDTVDVLDALPLLGNGKIDRASLPEATQHTAPPPAVEPAAETAFVDRLVELFAEVLDTDRVGRDDDFFDLGGDSLRAGRLVAALQARFGHFVPASLLLEASTPAALAAALSAGGDALLVPVRTAGSGVPLFVVHGGMGDVMFARPLAERLDAEQPVYALQPPTLRGPVPFAPTLTEVAERYVAEIRRVRPTGPYRLFGYSLGGVIAFEMATMLQDLGEEIELLALGDSQAPETMETLWRGHVAREKQEQAARSLATKVRAQVAHRRRQVGRRLAREPLRSAQWREFQRGAEPGPDIRGDAYLHVYGRLAFEHRLQRRFRGDLTLVLALQGDGPPERGWGPHVDGEVHTIVVDTHHLDLVVEPALTEVAHALSARRTR